MIDGYPRDTSQAAAFVQFIGTPTTVLHIDVPPSVMNGRLQERSNFDDTQESIYKRIDEFNTGTLPLVRKWNGITINADREQTEVYEDIKAALKSEKAFKEVDLEVEIK